MISTRRDGGISRCLTCIKNEKSTPCSKLDGTNCLHHISTSAVSIRYQLRLIARCIYRCAYTYDAAFADGMCSNQPSAASTDHKRFQGFRAPITTSAIFVPEHGIGLRSSTIWRYRDRLPIRATCITIDIIRFFLIPESLSSLRN